MRQQHCCLLFIRLAFANPSAEDMGDAYSILGVNHAATPSEIRRAYYRLALLVHPDKLPPSATAAERASAEERFKLIASAYGFNPSNYAFVFGTNVTDAIGTRY